MKNFKVVCQALFLGSLMTLVSCEKKDEIVKEEVSLISQEIMDKLGDVGLNPADIELRDIEDIDGKTKEMLVIEGDILMTKKQLLNMDVSGGITSKQYRTRNLVSTPRTIRVVGYNGNNRFKLSTVAQRGLRYAVNNYNALNINIQMDLVFTSNFNSNDIVAFTQTDASDIAQDGIRGRAGFPENGEPFKRIRINGGANNSNNDQIIEGLFTHELGHCVGLRHTDWNTRNSCGQSGESQEPLGAIYIPGTPGASQDPNSIMQACFPGARNQGEFGQFDKVALEYIY